MRTNIDIDVEAVRELMVLTGAKTMKDAVNEAVHNQLRQQRAASGIRALRGKIEWDGDIDAMRRDRV